MSIYEVKERPAIEGTFPINHALAGLVPIALPDEQAALTQDIAINGQKEPIVLWRGEVIDGRCRQKALETLHAPIRYKELDFELTEEEVEIFVKSMNTRRNLTETQKVASAAKEYTKHKAIKTVEQVAKTWGVSTGILNNAIWILKNYPDVLETLFSGKTVPIINSKNVHVESSRITAVYAHLKREEQQANTDYDHGWKEWTQIHTQKGKDLFYKELGIFHSLDPVLKDHLKIILIEYVNLKHRLEVSNG